MADEMEVRRRLAEALENAGAPDDVVAKAMAGYYGDYSSPVATPKIELVDSLREVARRQTLLAARVIEGEFDDGAPPTRTIADMIGDLDAIDTITDALTPKCSPCDLAEEYLHHHDTTEKGYHQFSAG